MKLPDDLAVRETEATVSNRTEAAGKFRDRESRPVKPIGGYTGLSESLTLLNSCASIGHF